MEPIRKLFAPKGTIIEDKNGVPAFEFVEDVYSHEPVLSRQVVELPSRKPVESNTRISPIVIAWHKRKTGRSLG